MIVIKGPSLTSQHMKVLVICRVGEDIVIACIVMRGCKTEHVLITFKNKIVFVHVFSIHYWFINLDVFHTYFYFSIRVWNSFRSIVVNITVGNWSYNVSDVSLKVCRHCGCGTLSIFYYKWKNTFTRFEKKYLDVCCVWSVTAISIPIWSVWGEKLNNP